MRRPRSGGARRSGERPQDVAAELALERERLAQREAGFRVMFADHPHPMWVHDAATLAILEVNRAAERYYGYARDRFLTMSVTDLHVPDDVLDAVGDLDDRPRPGDSGPALHRTHEGRVVEVDLLSQALDLDGRDVRLVVVEEMSEARRALRDLQESEERYALAMRGAADGLWDWNLASGTVYYSPRWKALLGFGEDDLSDHVNEWTSRVHPEDRQRVQAGIAAHFAGRTEHYEDEHRLLHRDGGYRWMLVRGIAIRSDDARPQRMAGSMTDITHRRESEQQRRLQAAALDAAGNMIVITDDRGVIQYVNPAYCQVTGFGADEVVGQTLVVADPGNDRTDTDEQIWSTLAAGATWRGEVISRRKDGTPYQEEQTITPIRDAEGSITHYVAIKSDITERKQHESQLNWLADHDPLTGLFNRRALSQRIETAVGAGRRGRPSALLYLDLDQFKVVNDLLGHVSGDRLLVTLAGVLKDRLRDEDVFFRLGGDEFAVLLGQVDPDQAMLAAEKLRSVVNEFRFTEGNQTFEIGASIGVALVDGRSEPDDVLRQADLACYTAKARGRNRVELYQAGETEQARLSADAQWSVRLKEALRENQFSLHYQPILRIADGSIGHHEALLRLREPDGTTTPPGAFVPAAERFGLIHEIDRWVIQAAFRRIAEESVGGRQFRLAINLSGLAFHDDRTLIHIREALATSGIDPGLVTFEITETAALADLPLARARIEAMRELGCKFALDDFGSGFSSFAYLRFLPVDYLKIDGAFIQNIAHDLVSQTMVRSMNDVAHAMGVETIAEFVENEQVLDVIRRIGVDYAQGYHIGHPDPVPREDGAVFALAGPPPAGGRARLTAAG